MPGFKRIMVVDAQMAGVSGDMMVGALIDLGADTQKVVRAMQTPGHYLAGCKRVEVTVREVDKKGFHARKVDIDAEEQYDERTSDELIEAASNSLNDVKISGKARKFALDCLNTLVVAEARVHGKIDTSHIHLHEMASVDTLADIVGTTVALDDLGVFKDTKVYATAVAVGGGLFKFSHGRVSSPAPATLEILRAKKFPMVGGQVEAELATPTGVSILTNLAHETIRFYPCLKPVAVGYGAGTKDFAEMPNVLRIVLGESCDALLSDEVYVIETNLDDTTGEVIGHTVDRLLSHGARDVSIIPIFGKKSRPGQIIKVIADRASLEGLSQILIEETGTLGVRFYPCERRILARESVPIKVTIKNRKRSVTVKVARDISGRVVQVKPDYDEVKKLAESSGVPFREISAIVLTEARKLFKVDAGAER